jgi:hypothetical protein
MPVRKIPKNYRNVTGIAAHRKAQGKAMFESTLERDFITLLEFDPLVETFEVQPLKIEWYDVMDKQRSYTPDVLAYYVQPRYPTTLFEVKYRSELRDNWQDLKPRFQSARRYASEKGWKFKLITEKEIRTPHLENAKFLMPFIRQGPQTELDMDILDDAIRTLDHSTPAQLLEHIYQDEWNRARLLPTLWYLIGTRQIATDLNTKVTMASPIWRLNA